MAKQRKPQRSKSARAKVSRSKDVSNKTVLTLLLATLAISLGGTFISLSTINSRMATMGFEPITGYALVPNGTATLTIQTSASIRFTAASLDWGTGTVDGPGNNCTLSTIPDGYGSNAGCSGFNNLSNGFTIENDGNTNLTVEMYSNVTPTQFIGVPTALFLWNVTVNETGSCVNKSGTTRQPVDPNTTVGAGGTCGGADEIACGTEFEQVTNVSTPNNGNNGKVICPSLLFADSNDALNIDINVSIPVDAPTGTKYAGIIVTGTTEG